MHYNLVFYQRILRNHGKFYKVLCNCFDCQYKLNLIYYKDIYRNILKLDKIITPRDIHNINYRIGSLCLMSPDDIFYVSSQVFIGYCEYRMNIAQIFLMICKHQGYRLGVVKARKCPHGN